MPAFMSGLALALAYYDEAVRPPVKPAHAVLGYDQPRSTDHAFGPRVQVFVALAEVDQVAAAIEEGLPDTFAGWPLRFFNLEANAVTHHVDVTTLDAFLRTQLGFDVDPRQGLSTAHWLALSQQRLLQVTAGAVFRDDTGELTAVRPALAWYPQDVWLWPMAAQWHLIGKCRAAGGTNGRGGGRARCGTRRREAGAPDDGIELPAGASLLALRQMVRDRVLTARRRRVAGAVARRGAGWVRSRRARGCRGPRARIPRCATQRARRNAARRSGHRSLPGPHQRRVRPYRVLNAGRFSAACRDAITDASLRALLPVGALDQLTHADDALVNFSQWPAQRARVYGNLLPE